MSNTDAWEPLKDEVHLFINEMDNTTRSNYAIYKLKERHSLTTRIEKFESQLTAALEREKVKDSQTTPLLQECLSYLQFGHLETTKELLADHIELWLTYKSGIDIQALYVAKRIETKETREVIDGANIDALLKNLGIMKASLEASLERENVKDEALKELKGFILSSTLEIKKHRSMTPAQLDYLFQRAYGLYCKYDVEGREALQAGKEGGV